ncbi:MAG: gliding motility-associated C-terminal domain-containing protein [Bacteroidota bacterium]|nr:gliding motility-associated C-terminal domain-containing protein [Bacteroidota bacterium]
MKFLSTLIALIFSTGFFHAQVSVFAKIDHLIPDGIDTQGGISLTVSGSTAPYTYLWNPGAQTTQNISNVASGQYSLLVTSASSQTYSNVYNLGYKVMWTNADRTVFRNDSLISTSPNTNIYGYAVSKNTLIPNTDGWVEYVVDNVTGTNTYLMGFTDSISPNSNTPIDIDYGIYYTTTKQLYYYENGANAVIKAAPKVGDVVRIERIGNTINYKINNAVVRTTTVSGISQKTLKVKAALRSSPVRLLNVGCSFEQLNNTSFINFVEARPIIKHCTDYGISDGSVKATPKIAASNTYLWQPGGATTQTNSGLSSGTTTLTISDGLSNSSALKYNVGYKVDWTNMDRCYLSNDSLISPTNSTSIYGTASSKNTLDPNVDGWVEYIVDNLSSNNFYLGFADNCSSLQYSLGDIDYGIMFSLSAKTFSYYESGTSAALTYAHRVGDVFRIERVGNSFIYKVNGVTVRTTTVSGVGQKSYKLKAQMLSVNRLVNVGCSFYNKGNCTFNNYVRVIPTVKHSSGLGATDGSVKVVPTIPLSNTYLWQPGGATTSTISSLSAATYSVSVTDALVNQSTYNYNVGYKILWTNMDRCSLSVTGDSLISTTNNANIIGHAESKNTLAAGVDGWLEYKVDLTNTNQFYLGFCDSINPNPYGAGDLDFGIRYTGVLYYYESGTTNTFNTHLRAGDIVRIERVGDNINYKVNNYQLRTVVIPGISQKNLKVKANLYSVNRLANVGCSFVESGNIEFANYVQVKPDITHNSSMGITDGQVKVIPRIPFSNTYNWQPGGSTLCSASQAAPGNYSVTISDAIQNSSKFKFNVGYKVNWTNLYNASVSGDTLKGTTTGTGSANSRDTLLPNTNGWIEYVYSEPANKSFYFGFLDVPSANQALVTDIDYGFYWNTTQYMYQYENGTSTIYSYNYRPGDVLRIERSGDTIKYSINYKVSRTTVTPGLFSKALLVKATVLNKAKLIKLGASFTACKFTAEIANAGFGSSISCANPIVTLTGATNAPEGSTYLWTPGNATTSSIDVSNIGEYTFKVTNPANGCAAESKVNVTTPELPQLFLNTTLLNDTIVGTDSTKIQVGLNSAIIDTLDAGGTDTLGINPLLSSNTLEFTLRNNNFSDTRLMCITNKLGCINSVQAFNDSIYVPLDSSLFQIRNYKELVIVPLNSTHQLKTNIISTPYLDLEEGMLMSPNGDNQYDDLKLARYETNITSFELNIYNTSQELVYTTHEKAFIWNGKDSNSQLLQGTFNYTMNIDGNLTSGSFLIEK